MLGYSAYHLVMPYNYYESRSYINGMWNHTESLPWHFDNDNPSLKRSVYFIYCQVLSYLYPFEGLLFAT